MIFKKIFLNLGIFKSLAIFFLLLLNVIYSKFLYANTDLSNEKSLTNTNEKELFLKNNKNQKILDKNVLFEDIVLQNTKVIAIVDVKSILEESEAMLSIRDAIQEISNTIEKELTTKESVLKKIEKDLIQERDKIDKEEFEKKVTDFGIKVSQAQKEVQVKKIALEKAHADAVSVVNEQMKKIILELSEKYNLDLVLPSTQILFAKDNLNITLKVKNLLNDTLKKVPIKYYVPNPEK